MTRERPSRAVATAAAAALFCAAAAPVLGASPAGTSAAPPAAASPAGAAAGSPAAASPLGAPAGREVGWDEAFSTSGAPGGLSLTAVVLDREGKEHRIRLFRDGEAQLRRDTDQTEILIRRSAGDEVYRVIRRAQGVGYRVHARNLFRIGVALDWSSLATLLARPRAPARVATLARAEEATRFGACRWKEAAAQGLRVCWSERLRIPLSVEEKRGSGWTRSLRIEELQEGPVPASAFAAPADLREIDLDAQSAPETD